MDNLEITQEISPVDRAATTSNLDLSLSDNAQFPIELLKTKGSAPVLCRVDMYLPGMTLDEVVNVFYGPVTQDTPNSYNRAVKLSAEDGEPFRKIQL